LAAFFDGLCDAAIGVIAVTAAELLGATVEGTQRDDEDIKEKEERLRAVGPAAVIYVLSLAVLYWFTNKYTAVLLVVCGAIAGEFLFV
jgi:hypothetical protein